MANKVSQVSLVSLRWWWWWHASLDVALAQAVDSQQQMTPVTPVTPIFNKTYMEKEKPSSLYFYKGLEKGLSRVTGVTGGTGRKNNA